MIARFQKERFKQTRNTSIFNLDSSGQEDAFQLTHKGKILSNDNVGDNEWSDNEEDDDKLGKEIVTQLHFGGGMVKKASAEGLDKSKLGYENPYNNHLTALQEIVAKSKMYKAQKKETKLEQEETTDKLDMDFQSLLQESMVEFREDYKDSKKSKRNKSGDEADEDDYDRALTMMQFEAKVQPSDRTKSAEELALEERERLEEQEKQRLLRMKAGYQPAPLARVEGDETEGVSKKRGKGKKDRQRKPVTDDDLDDSFGGAAAFEDEAIEEEEEEEDGEIDDDDEEDDAEEDNADENEDKDDEDDGDDEDNEEDEEDDEDGEGEADEEEDIEEEEEEDEVYQAPRRPKKSKPLGEPQANDDIPYKIECPNDMQAFDELLDTHARSSDDVMTIIDRILAYSSVHLPGHGGRNHSLMHNFMEMLLRHFVRVGTSLSQGRTDEDLIATMKQVCVITIVILYRGFLF